MIETNNEYITRYEKLQTELDKARGRIRELEGEVLAYRYLIADYSIPVEAIQQALKQHNEAKGE